MQRLPTHQGRSCQALRPFKQPTPCPARRCQGHNNPTSAAARRAGRKQQRVVPCSSSSLGPSADDVAPPPRQQLSAMEQENTLERLELLRRQLETAVAQEDYSRAQELKQQADALKQQLSPIQQYLQAQLVKLRQGGSMADKLAALKGIGEHGGEECLPDLAACCSDQELAEAATATMWRVFNKHPNKEVQDLMEFGVAFLEKRNYAQALEAFEAACKLEPSFAEAHNKRATVLYLLDKCKDSIEVCELVLQLNPYHFGAASGMGLCYMRLQDFKSARKAFERTLEINPGLEDIRGYVVALTVQFPDEEE